MKAASEATGEIGEILGKLRGPFKLEERSGFRDEAVVGGFGQFVTRWSEYASASARGPLRRDFRSLARLFNRYATLGLRDRRIILDRGKDLLAAIDSKLAGKGARQVGGLAGRVRPAASASLDRDIQYLKGVGPRRAAVLARLRIRTVGELLYHFPRSYEDRSRIRPIAHVREGEIETIEGQVLRVSGRRVRKGLHLLKVTVRDTSGSISGVWFNRPYLEKELVPGTKVLMTGRVETHGARQMTNPAYEALSGDEEDLIHTGRIVPIYPLTEGLPERWFRALLKRVVETNAGALPDIIPEPMRQRLDLVSTPEALGSIHFPETELHRARAYRRLVFDEFLLLQLMMGMRRARKPGAKRRRHPGAGHKMFERMVRSLGFVLTEDQQGAIEDIRRDMSGDRPMNRLVQGEVGSGKTLVAAAAILVSYEHGEHAAFMAPTEILARQHLVTLQRMLVPLGLTVNLLTGGCDAGTRSSSLEEARDGQADVTVGTHALLEEDVRFRKLGLVIIDEQHRFGVLQREKLRDKSGSECDLLILTATPIPRTLALTVFGDLDVSTMKELPAGREPVATYLVPSERREGVYRFACEEMRKGRQVFCIAPVVENGSEEVRAATGLFNELRHGVFGSFSVGLVHGQLKAAEKESVMRGFREGKLQALVATSVLEVGIDVANATVIIVENAERFGLAQLHQMRGRVGRGSHPSYCILLASPQSDAARRRLETMIRTSDGFRIAEEDLAIRGPGEFLGLRQHGLFDVAIGNLAEDMELLELARDEARSLLEKDAGLSQPEHAGVRRALARRWGRPTQAPGR